MLERKREKLEDHEARSMLRSRADALTAAIHGASRLIRPCIGLGIVAALLLFPWFNKTVLSVEWRPTLGPTTRTTIAATPSPTATLTSFQPAPPIQAAFFYPWFPDAWTQGGTYPYTNYSPSLGLYDSRSDAVIDEQLRLAASAHLEAMISSWWGPGHSTDSAFQHILARSERSDSPFPNLRWAVYYEPESLGDPTVSEITAHLQYLTEKAFGHPGYLRVSGRPVVFVYSDDRDGTGLAERWAKAKAAFGGKVYIVLKVYSGYPTDPNQPDSWHQYGPAVAYDTQLPYSVTLSPGFWKVGEQPRLPRDVGRFEADVQRMAASGAFWQLISSWNEWGEGTSIEPAKEFSHAYADILCRQLPGVPACTTVTPTPAPHQASESLAVLVGAGDIASCDGAGDEATASLLDAIEGTIFTTGDHAYPEGSVDDFQCYDSSWGRQKARTRPAAGNHDYETKGAAGYFGYFGNMAGDPATGYYSYDLGSWHVVVINSNCSEVGGCQAGSPQEQWLRADLAAHPAVCTIAYWHHPLFSSGMHGSHPFMKAIWQALYDHGADIVMNGHDHLYERFAPQDPDGNIDPARGIRQFTVGTGGKELYGFNTQLANSEVRNSDTFGLLKLTLHVASYNWQWVPEAGKTFGDSGGHACH